MDHISGVMMLMRLRGKEQLQNPLGLQLFRQLRSLIVTSPQSRTMTLGPVD